MNEKTYENILIKHPDIIDAESTLFLKNQLKLSDGSLIDVVLHNKNKDVYYLIELQKNKVDKLHLGKIIIYKDLFSKDFNISQDKIKMILMADDCSSDYFGFLKTFDIEFKSLSIISDNYLSSDKKLSIRKPINTPKDIYEALSNLKSYSVRGMNVYIDRDVSFLYSSTTRLVNLARKRKKDVFKNISFSLTKQEYYALSKKHNIKIHNDYNPIVYTEEALFKLSYYLHNPIADQISEVIFKSFKFEKENV